MKESNSKSLIRKGGLKATPARIDILKILSASKAPLSAQEVIEKASWIDQVTVYRILKAFKDKGLIKQIDLRHNHAHYEVVGIDDHHHLVCISCGRIQDVHECDVEEMYKAILQGASTFAEIRQHSLEFYGVCKTCSKRSGAPSLRVSNSVAN